MTETYDDWDLKKNITVEDAGMGHGYTNLEGFPMFDSQKEGEEWVEKLILMKAMYDEIMEQKEYIPQLEVVYQKAKRS